MRRITSTILTLLLSASCSPRAERADHAFRTFTEEGVTICETTGGPKFTGNIFDLEKVLEIRPDPDDEDALLNGPSSFLRGPDGCFYVVDSGNHRIAVFGPGGEYLRSIGREGSGPGEFRQLSLTGLDGDILTIFDRNLRRLTRLRIDGSIEGIHSLRMGSNLRRTSSAMVTGIYYAGEGVVIEKREYRDFGTDRSTLSMAMIVMRSDTGDTLSVIETGSTEYGVVERVDSGNTYSVIIRMLPYAASPSALYDPRLGILTTGGTEPEINWYSIEGDLLRQIRIDIPLRPVDQSLKQRFLDRQDRARKEYEERTGRTQQEAPRWSFPDYIGFSCGARIDDSGFIWLSEIISMTLHEGDEWYLNHVIDPEGRYLGTTGVPAYSFLVMGGELFAVLTDPETDEGIPTVFRIVPAVDGLDYPG